MAVGINPNIQTAYSQSFGAKEGKKTGGAGKAVASAIIPGSGQLIDGRVGAGLGFLGGATGIATARYLLEKDAVKFLLLEYNPLQSANLGNINILKTQRRGEIRYLPFVTTLESIKDE